MSKRKWRAGVIGCGAIAEHCHIPGYLKSKHAKLAAFADPLDVQRKKVARLAPEATAYGSHEEMLAKEQLDVVSVCTPNVFHAEHTLAGLKAGAHVFLEKPAALTMAEIARMKQAAREAGKQIVVGFTHRFLTGPRQAKKLIEKGAIGEPYMIRVRFAHGGPYPGWAQGGPWFYDPQKAGGGAMLDMGIHAIDLCNWLIGPVAEVAAQVGTLRKDIAVDDNAVLALKFANGRALGYIEVGWTSPAGFTGLEIMGDAGCITIDYATKMLLTTDKASADHNARSERKVEVVDEKPNTGGWAVEVDEIVPAMQAGKDLGVGIDAGGAALAVALAAYESARTGQRVKVPS